VSRDSGGVLPPDVFDPNVNALRFLAVDAVERASSGHPGTPLAMAPVIYRLFTRFLKHDPAHADWPDRDRFVLSGGHASMLLYGALHLSGYDLSLEDLMQFRRLGSRTPGHPERGMTPGVEVTTGPLGQGIANAVGLALAERMAARTFNGEGLPIIDHRTWVLCGDGDMMEGIASEAASLAGHLRLERLVLLYDSNLVTLDGPSELSFDEDVATRFLGYGFRVLHLRDVDDHAEVDRVLGAAMATRGQPTLVVMQSHIGIGSPFHDSNRAHGAALGADAVAKTRETLRWPYAPFEVPAEVYEAWRPARASEWRDWDALLAQHRVAEPDRAAELERRLLKPRLAERLGEPLAFAAGSELSTRVAMGKVLASCAETMPELVGGAADVESSTETRLPGRVMPPDYEGRDLYFGVREHAMAAITNGIAAYGGFVPFASTFFVFSDYLKPALRLACIMGLRVVYLFTHDSIALGEDGTTHQPIEQLASLRSVPGLTLVRPADANETQAALRYALGEATGPVALVLTRQGLPVLAETAGVGPRELAGHVLREGDGPTLVATGSEVSLALAAASELAERGHGARVVSVPSVELLRALAPARREELLGSHPRIAVEAGTPYGWYEFCDEAIGLEEFGASGRRDEVLEAFGFTPHAIATRVEELLGRTEGSGDPKGGA
jgi:transketolase